MDKNKKSHTFLYGFRVLGCEKNWVGLGVVVFNFLGLGYLVLGFWLRFESATKF